MTEVILGIHEGKPPKWFFLLPVRLEDAFDPMILQLCVDFFRMSDHVSVGVFTKISGWPGAFASELFEKKTFRLVSILIEGLLLLLRPEEDVRIIIFFSNSLQE